MDQTNKQNELNARIDALVEAKHTIDAEITKLQAELYLTNDSVIVPFSTVEAEYSYLTRTLTLDAV